MTQVRKEVPALLNYAWTPPKELPEKGVDELLRHAYKSAFDLQHALRSVR